MKPSPERPMTMSLEEARGSFPATGELVYLDAAAFSLVSTPVHEAIQSFLELCLHPGSSETSRHYRVIDAMRQRAIREAAVLLHCQEGQIALVESTTHGLNIAANAIPLRSGDRVLVADTEFLQVAIPWKMKEASLGVEVVPVPTGPDGELTPGHFESVMDERTRVVCVSSVQWCSGYRVNLKELGSLCRSRDIYLVVDAIQQLGACPLDLQDTPVDFLMAGGHKWLNAPFGCGILYVSPRCISQLDPDSWGYLALQSPPGGWGEYFQTPDISPYSEWTFQQNATRFEIGGTSNYPGAVGLGASLAQINELGIHTIHRHVLDLGRHLREGLEDLGAYVVSPAAPEDSRSGITIFQMTGSPEGDRMILEELLARRIYLAQRFTSGIGGLRASTHFFNDTADVDALLDALRDLRP